MKLSGCLFRGWEVPVWTPVDPAAPPDGVAVMGLPLSDGLPPDELAVLSLLDALPRFGKSIAMHERPGIVGVATRLFCSNVSRSPFQIRHE